MSGSIAVDVVLSALLLAYLVGGLRRGLLVESATLGGLLLGATGGILLVPRLAAGIDSDFARALVVLIGVVALAVAGQTAGAVLGGHVRSGVTSSVGRLVDRALGGLAAVVVAVTLLSLLLGALRATPDPAVARMIGRSHVAQAVDRVTPDAVNRLAGGMARTVAADFPRVFDGIAPEVIVPVDPPDADEVGEAAAVAGPGVVRVQGAAGACDRSQEGSGFVVAPHRVVTNAHVVAGVREPTVQVLGQGERLEATVVLFDPERDLAVLSVPELAAAPLAVGDDLSAGDAAMVVGFPQGGPFATAPARVRQVLTARGKDIYGDSGAVREVYSLYVRVRPGNSGGPVLDADGAVVGVVFATSLDDPDTGYALTLDEAGPVLDAAAGASRPVDVGPCSGE